MKKTEYVDTVRPQGPCFVIETVKVVREVKEHYFGASGRTIGELVDEAVHEALATQQELLDINLHFEREDWHEMAKDWGTKATY